MSASDKEFLSRSMEKAKKPVEYDEESVEFIDDLYKDKSNNIHLKISDMGKENPTFDESNLVVTKF